MGFSYFSFPLLLGAQKCCHTHGMGGLDGIDIFVGLTNLHYYLDSFGEEAGIDTLSRSSLKVRSELPLAR